METNDEAEHHPQKCKHGTQRTCSRFLQLGMLGMNVVSVGNRRKGWTCDETRQNQEPGQRWSWAPGRARSCSACCRTVFPRAISALKPHLTGTRRQCGHQGSVVKGLRSTSKKRQWGKWYTAKDCNTARYLCMNVRRARYLLCFGSIQTPSMYRIYRKGYLESIESGTNTFDKERVRIRMVSRGSELFSLQFPVLTSLIYSSFYVSNN